VLQCVVVFCSVLLQCIASAIPLHVTCWGEGLEGDSTREKAGRKEKKNGGGWGGGSRPVHGVLDQYTNR